MKLLKNKKGVFGLNAVQTFFAVILGIALLAYIIVVVMGVLGGTTILKQSAYTQTNETGGFINQTGYTLSRSTSESGYTSPTITQIVNNTDGSVINSGNWTISGSTLRNATEINYNTISISYTYTADSSQQRNLNTILSNTSTGVTGFFSSINPVYAILAVLVIILILVVLVRVVQSPNRTGSTPSL